LTRLYQDPELYDRLHAEGTAEEARLLVDLFELHGNGGSSWLEPACGTGRLLSALARKGFTVTGYDSEPNAVGYAKKKLAKYGTRARVVHGDLKTFVEPESFDAAFCLLGTVRHLMSDSDLLAHLTCVAESLKKGGIYILGLDLADYALAQDDEEVWEGHVVVCVAPDRRMRRERVINLVTTDEGVIESSYDLRSYDLAQWRAILAKSPFEVAEEQLYPRLEVPAGTRDSLWVLRLR
jgi:SAM-dependent methyltransferase